jgi:hypothetical protein
MRSETALYSVSPPRLIPSAVRNEPLIHQLPRSHDVSFGTGEQSVFQLHKNLDRGDGLIRGLWEPSTDCIIDVRFTGYRRLSYLSKDPAKVLEQQEKKRRNILSLVLSNVVISLHSSFPPMA